MAQPYPRARRTIMVVEDDDDVREALMPVLEYEAYDVVGAANGREAIDRLRDAEPPSLILLDLMMPVMDGSQFRTEQLRDPLLASIPVIILSADGTVREKARALRAAAYMQKPVEVDGLLDLIRRYS